MFELKNNWCMVSIIIGHRLHWVVYAQHKDQACLATCDPPRRYPKPRYNKQYKRIGGLTIKPREGKGLPDVGCHSPFPNTEKELHSREEEQ